jgi:hypothetical protein
LLADLHRAAPQYRCRSSTRRSGSKYNPQFKHLRCPARAIVSPGSVEQNGHANRAAAAAYARRKRKHAKKIGQKRRLKENGRRRSASFRPAESWQFQVDADRASPCAVTANSVIWHLTFQRQCRIGLQYAPSPDMPICPPRR